MSTDRSPASNNKAPRRSIVEFFTRAANAAQKRVTPPVKLLWSETAYMREDYSIEVVVQPVQKEAVPSADDRRPVEFVVTPSSPVYMNVLKNHPVLRPGVMHTMQRMMQSPNSTGI
jgi:hypothetical protein